MKTMNELTPYAETIVKLVGTFGCIEDKQLEVMMESPDYPKLKRNLSFLSHNRFIALKDNIVFPFPAKNKLDWELIDCIWVAMDKAKKSDGTYMFDDLINSFSNRPVSIVMINSEENVTYNIVGITEGNIDSTLPFIIERFKSDHKGNDIKKIKNIQYIFVVKDTNLISDIAEFDPPMPNKIALLTDDENIGKKVRYLSKK